VITIFEARHFLKFPPSSYFHFLNLHIFIIIIITFSNPNIDIVPNCFEMKLKLTVIGYYVVTRRFIILQFPQSLRIMYYRRADDFNVSSFATKVTARGNFEEYVAQGTAAGAGRSERRTMLSRF
jgi:hypothetical protein